MSYNATIKKNELIRGDMNYFEDLRKGMENDFQELILRELRFSLKYVMEVEYEEARKEGHVEEGSQVSLEKQNGRTSCEGGKVNEGNQRTL